MNWTYEERNPNNRPIQLTVIFFDCKNDDFQVENCDILHNFPGITHISDKISNAVRLLAVNKCHVQYPHGVLGHIDLNYTYTI